jgi:pyruvate kinase
MAAKELPAKKTKIVCTIGPASSSPAVLEKMIRSGMNIARINFAHGDFNSHRRDIANIRAAARRMGQRVSIMGDLPGPKMRIGKLAEEPIELKRGQSFILQTKEIVGSQERVSMDFAGLTAAVKPGDNIFMNDGYIQLSVEQVVDHEIHCTVRVGGELRSNKGVNFPGIDLGIDAFTAQDREFLAFAAELGLDAISQSFVQNAKDIEAVRSAAAEMDYQPFIIAKIERAGAVKHIGDILQVVDGLMVARGDLGVEIPIEEIPSTQKSLIRQANLWGKPVITATQMLESMIGNRRPTRAEVTDVANAILDGTDAVMLSGETAVGSYPDETVAVMSRIARLTEERHSGDFGIRHLFRRQHDRRELTQMDTISLNLNRMAETLDPSLVVVPALTGGTARLVTRFRLSQWIIAPSRDESTCQKLQFSFGVLPVYVSSDAVLASLEERQAYSRRLIREYSQEGDVVLLIEGSGTLKDQDTKRIDIVNIGS